MDFDLEKALPILQRTPAVLRALLSGLPEEWTGRNEGGESWSAYDVVGHLIHGEKTDWMLRTRQMLGQQGEVTFKSFDRYAQFRESQGKSLAQLLDEFEQMRHANLRELTALQFTEKELGNRARHPELGTVTLGQLLASWVVHDLGHIGQISRVMAHQYRNAVGPWIAFLGILKKPIV